MTDSISMIQYTSLFTSFFLRFVQCSATLTFPIRWYYKVFNLLLYEPLTISPVAAQYNGACGKRSSIECVHIDRCWPQKSWRWRQRSTLNLDSDKFRCSNYRDELYSTVFLPNFRLVTLLQSPYGPAPCSDACYIKRKASFIYPRHYVSQGNT